MSLKHHNIEFYKKAIKRKPVKSKMLFRICMMLCCFCSLAWNKGVKSVPSYWTEHHCLWLYFLAARYEKKPLALPYQVEFPMLCLEGTYATGWGEKCDLKDW